MSRGIRLSSPSNSSPTRSNVAARRRRHGDRRRSRPRGREDGFLDLQPRHPLARSELAARRHPQSLSRSSMHMRRWAVLGLIAALAACAPTKPPTPPPDRLVFSSASFGDLAGWGSDGVGQALAALKKSCGRRLGFGDEAPVGPPGYGGQGRGLAPALRRRGRCRRARRCGRPRLLRDVVPALPLRQQPDDRRPVHRLLRARAQGLARRVAASRRP